MINYSSCSKLQIDWTETILATRSYDIPLEGKIPYDFRKIEKSAKILNSEIDKNEALTLAKQEIENHHRFLLLRNIDRIISAKTTFETSQSIYLHAPIWFLKYEYKNKSFDLILDGNTGIVLKADIPWVEKI